MAYGQRHGALGRETQSISQPSGFKTECTSLLSALDGGRVGPRPRGAQSERVFGVSPSLRPIGVLSC